MSPGRLRGCAFEWSIASSTATRLAVRCRPRGEGHSSTLEVRSGRSRRVKSTSPSFDRVHSVRLSLPPGPAKPAQPCTRNRLVPLWPSDALLSHGQGKDPRDHLLGFALAKLGRDGDPVDPSCRFVLRRDRSATKAGAAGSLVELHSSGEPTILGDHGRGCPRRSHWESEVRANGGAAHC